MNRPLIPILILLLLQTTLTAQQPIIRPYETDAKIIANTPLDRLVQKTLKEYNIKPAIMCSDEVFIRRVYLDVIGTLPTYDEVQQFTQSTRKNKRKELIDDLLQRNEFADYWSLKWCDLLRVKSEFPINLWPNAVQAYHHWVHDSIAKNKPYDDFVRELLTSSGSNFRVPPVNFYRAIQGKEPSTIASTVSLTFMGTRLETWPEQHRLNLETFFSRVAFKGTAEWKEEIVYNDPSPTEPLQVTFPDGTTTIIPAGQDPRQVFADWLIQPDNEWFTRNIVNRIWAWLIGRGIIHEPDNIYQDNQPANPELLAYLEREFIKSHCDLQHIYRLILNSRTYQQSTIPQSTHPQAESLFAHYIIRPLEAEVLIDALCQICGPEEAYESNIPEPFTFIPEEQRTITLSDGSITSPFLEMFGRPARDTGFVSERADQPTNAQRLHLLNSTHVQRKIERGANIRQLMQSTRRDNRRIITTLYLVILSREPTRSEVSDAESYFRSDEINPRQATNDLTWALINTKEFLYRH